MLFNRLFPMNIRTGNGRDSWIAGWFASAAAEWRKCDEPLICRARGAAGPRSTPQQRPETQRSGATMAIKVGDKMPKGQFARMGANGPEQLSTDDLFRGKKVVLFSVPGAFTPTCSAKHLPGFVQNADVLKAKGVDTIACMAVNDVFVMSAWGKSSSTGDKVMMLADGNGEYVRALGLDLDASKFGMGTRGKRFSLIVDDGVVKQLNLEPAGEFGVSSAEAALEQLG
jgi:peroxiredoxin